MSVNAWSAPAPVTRRVRAYFAVVSRAAAVPVLFDPAQQSRFALESPPTPWISLGWIRDFARKSLSQSASILTGIPAAPLDQVRERLGAQISFQFLSWTKLTMALATGSQHMNLLASSGATLAADGGTATVAVAIQSGSTASSIVLSASDAANFSAGQIVAVDVDNSGQTGYVGTPISGAYIKSALSDVDYVRRVTFNVALVASVSSTTLTLASPLPAGVPTSAMKMQAVTGFVDREGGSFYPEWSALFVMEGCQGEHIFFYYPRLQPLAGAEEEYASLDSKQKSSLARVLLKAQFLALPVTDSLDGERVVCYRSFVPASMALV
jgi:hypothetical protein